MPVATLFEEHRQILRRRGLDEVAQAYYSLVTNTLDKNNLSILGKMYLDRIYNRTVKSTNVNVT